MPDTDNSPRADPSQSPTKLQLMSTADSSSSRRRRWQLHRDRSVDRRDPPELAGDEDEKPSGFWEWVAFAIVFLLPPW